MVQIGTKLLPIVVTPRINGKVVTQTEIKTASNAYISDQESPLRFGLEFKRRGEDITVVDWDENKSTDTEIYFPVPNSLWDTLGEYTVLCFWTVGTTEKIYSIVTYHIAVEESHDK